MSKYTEIDDLYKAIRKLMKRKYPDINYYTNPKHLQKYQYPTRPEFGQKLYEEVSDPRYLGKFFPMKYRGKKKKLKDFFQSDIIFNKEGSLPVLLHELAHAKRVRSKSPLTKLTRQSTRLDEKLTNREARKFLERYGKNLRPSDKEKILNLLT